MHSAWEELMSAYTSDSSVLIASADCETSSRSPGTGKSLCNAESLPHYPYILYGKGNNMREYQGSRSYSELQQFVESHKNGEDDAPPVPVVQPTCALSKLNKDVVV